MAASVEGGSAGFSSKSRMRPSSRERDDPVVRSELERPDVADGDRARRSLRAPERREVGEAEVEQVVAGDHEQVVVELRLLEHEQHVADRAEPVLVRARAVVVDDHVTSVRPACECADLVRVRDDVDLVDDLDRSDRLDDPVDDRPPADRQQLLRPRVGERTKPRRVPRREDDRLHAVAPTPASDRAVRRPVDAVLGHDRRDQRCGRDVEGGVARRETGRDLARDRVPRSGSPRRPACSGRAWSSGATT